MPRRTINQELLNQVLAKRVTNVKLHTAHGDVLEITFDDGTTLGVSTTYGLMDKTIEPDVNDLYITINDMNACPQV